MLAVNLDSLWWSVDRFCEFVLRFLPDWVYIRNGLLERFHTDESLAPTIDRSLLTVALFG